MEIVYGRLPTIPEYYKQFIDKSVDLEYEPKQCCPFHKEDTPSFSYSASKGVWRCFGACQWGGDVIELHRKKTGLKSRKEAEASLKSMFRVVERQQSFSQSDIDMCVNKDNVELESAFQKALILADTPEKWIQLDYVMSIYPLEVVRLQELVDGWSIKEGR